MGKNVSILEGGTASRMGGVTRLITDDGSGGTDLWVPVDERLTRTKYITKNGTYLASDDQVYAFSKLTVNIMGGAQGLTTPTVPLAPYNVEIPDTSVDPVDLTPISGLTGSSIAAIDPIDGNKYVATVNPDGTLSTSVVPAAIVITKMPSKLSYADGETIDYSGIEVSLYLRFNESTEGGHTVIDAEPFHGDDKYPDGKIPFGEITLPKTEAEGMPSESDIYSDPYGITAKAFHCTRRVDFQYTRGYAATEYHAKVYGTKYEFVVIPKQADVFMTIYDGNLYVAYVGEDPVISYGAVACERYVSNDANGTQWYGHNPFTMGDNKFAYCYYDVQGSEMNGIPESSIDPVDKSSRGLVADTFMEVPVQWTSPYDGITYETSFRIEVSPSQEGGGGSGHSF